MWFLKLLKKHTSQSFYSLVILSCWVFNTMQVDITTFTSFFFFCQVQLKIWSLRVTWVWEEPQNHLIFLLQLCSFHVRIIQRLSHGFAWKHRGYVPSALTLFFVDWTLIPLQLVESPQSFWTKEKVIPHSQRTSGEMLVPVLDLGGQGGIDSPF